MNYGLHGERFHAILSPQHETMCHDLSVIVDDLNGLYWLGRLIIFQLTHQSLTSFIRCTRYVCTGTFKVRYLCLPRQILGDKLLSMGIE